MAICTDSKEKREKYQSLCLFLYCVTVLTAQNAIAKNADDSINQLIAEKHSEILQEADWRVTQVLAPKDKERMLVMPFGSLSGIIDGMILHVERFPMGAKSDPVQTGKVKVVHVGNNRSLAIIIEEGSALSKLLFPEFPGIMAGDQLVRPTQSLQRVTVVAQTVTLLYKDLFLDPRPSPITFELSPLGKSRLKLQADKFQNLRLSLLSVKGYTDAEGDNQINQIESYQRSMTVRQFLIDDLGFDAARVEAFGLGETDIADNSNVDQYKDNNRRIVLKAVPINFK